MFRTLLRRVGVLALATTATTSLAVTPASAVDVGYYKNAYSDTIYRYNYGTHTPIDYATWERAGFPEPRATPTSYVKYAWSPHVYAVTFWDDAEDTWQWERMDFAMWDRAGKPTPRDAGWIEGSQYLKWATADELFVLSDGITHKLTYAEWQASGFRPAAEITHQGFMKMTWAPEIRYIDDLATYEAYLLTYDRWEFFGFPTPRAVHRLPGDGFFTDCENERTIIYDGPLLLRAITYDEWVAAGRPAPSETECIKL
ncbi:hypothetical protein [Actinokineospora pegani]|uniref:hypothetical protein n=1 Tax=Actinokineospora pegani TaxID=2654637 RepID=UPI0012EAAD2B|nr:hypothetical protein [Actinokineospora pegani]